MSKLQKKYLCSRLGGVVALVSIILEIYGIAVENSIALFLFAVFIALIAALIAYEWIWTIIYEWRIRGALQEDEWSFYRWWYRRIWDGEFETIEKILSCDHLPADDYQSRLKTLEKIKGVKRPRWLL